MTTYNHTLADGVHTLTLTVTEQELIDNDGKVNIDDLTDPLTQTGVSGDMAPNETQNNQTIIRLIARN